MENGVKNLKGARLFPKTFSNHEKKIVKVAFEWGGMTEEMKAAKIKRLLESGAAPPKSGDTFEKFEKPGGTLSRQGPKKFIIWVDVQLAKN